MSFSSSGLSIGQYSGVISLKDRDNTLLGSIFVDKFLSAPLVIDIVESETLPHAQVLVDIHILLSLFFSDLGSEILHDAAALALSTNVDYRPELAALDFFSR